MFNKREVLTGLVTVPTAALLPVVPAFAKSDSVQTMMDDIIKYVDQHLEIHQNWNGVGIGVYWDNLKKPKLVERGSTEWIEDNISNFLISYKEKGLTTCCHLTIFEHDIKHFINVSLFLHHPEYRPYGNIRFIKFESGSARYYYKDDDYPLHRESPKRYSKISFHRIPLDETHHGCIKRSYCSVAWPNVQDTDEYYRTYVRDYYKRII